MTVTRRCEPREQTEDVLGGGLDAERSDENGRTARRREIVGRRLADRWCRVECVANN